MAQNMQDGDPMPAIPALIVAAWTLAAEPAKADPQRFWIGLVDGRTALTPIALYEDGLWFNPWRSRDLSDQGMELAFDRIPVLWWGGRRPPATWQLWRRRGDVVPLRLLGSLLPHECSAPRALKTDYRLKADDARSDYDAAYARDVGIASDTSDLSAQPLMRVQDAEVNAALAVLFDGLERREVARTQRRTSGAPKFIEELLTPILKGRPGPGLRYKVWSHRSAVRGARFYFARVERRYVHEGGWGTNDSTIVRVQAWMVRADDDRLRLVSAQTDLVNLDPALDAFEPLALISAGGEEYAVGVWLWSDGRDARVLRVRPTGITLMASKVLSGC